MVADTRRDSFTVVSLEDVKSQSAVEDQCKSLN